MKNRMGNLVVGFFFLWHMVVICLFLTVDVAYARPLDLTPAEWNYERIGNHQLDTRKDNFSVSKLYSTEAIVPECNEECKAIVDKWMKDLGLGVVVKDQPVGEEVCSIGSMWNEEYQTYSYFTRPECLFWATQYIPPGVGEIRYCRQTELFGKEIGVFFNYAPGFISTGDPPFVECVWS